MGTKNWIRNSLKKKIMKMFKVLFDFSADVLHKKWSFMLELSLVNITKYAVFRRFFHIY